MFFVCINAQTKKPTFSERQCSTANPKYLHFNKNVQYGFVENYFPDKLYTLSSQFCTGISWSFSSMEHIALIFIFLQSNGSKRFEFTLITSKVFYCHKIFCTVLCIFAEKHMSVHDFFCAFHWTIFWKTNLFACFLTFSYFPLFAIIYLTIFNMNIFA